MCSANEIQRVLFQEFLDYVWAKCIGNSTNAFTKAFYVTFWVRPEEIAIEALFWDVKWSIQVINLENTIQIGRETSVHAENPVRN